VDVPARVRLDKWLWAARFYKTRALAVQAIDNGRVVVNGVAAKPGREMTIGDRLVIRQQGFSREVLVCALSSMRGPASAAALLYQETAASVAARARAREEKRLAPPVANAQGRPTKRDRRALAEWQRWSASADE
jgi:ribosome-associated heat shock protein Hsp15